MTDASFIQLPLPHYVQMVVDYKNLGDFRWCLLLNSCPQYHHGDVLSITPSYCEGFETHVEECSGTMLFIRGPHLLHGYRLDDKLIGALVYNDKHFPDMNSLSIFLDYRRRGYFINYMKEILKNHGVTLKRF